ncbi:hypothetical protein [Streptomyces sp. NBC_00893]|uniref:hypothetical protein n=1 Tax=Streptomyces sp. NBC_00893 TaxID=2975862 RepID=UPI00224CCDC3|nr:hypothetical protein [Streptomyces sp. NBC_00893]MCX4849841.1 hypothetical protein [Streptomyces sp. NBC_00893]
MSATSTLHVQCPECDLLIPITTQTRSATSTCDHLVIVVEPDFTDIWAHAWTHGDP